MSETKLIHVFEKAGLGKAPFKFVGMEAQDIRYGQRVLAVVNGVTFSTKPGGTCDYCGQYIVNIYNIESADGKRFHVGCDCVKKTGDAGLVSAADMARKALESEQRWARKERKIDELLKDIERAIPKITNKLKAKPHPQAYRASQGLTLFDYIDWLVKHRCADMAWAYVKEFV